MFSPIRDSLRIRWCQGSQWSARFEFPDISPLFSLTFPDLTARIGQISHINPSKSSKTFGPTNIGFNENMSRNIWQNLVHLLKPDQNSLTFTDSRLAKILKFPDFPEGNIFPWSSLIFPHAGNPVMSTKNIGQRIAFTVTIIMQWTDLQSTAIWLGTLMRIL